MDADVFVATEFQGAAVGENSDRTIDFGSLIISGPLPYRCVTTASD